MPNKALVRNFARGGLARTVPSLGKSMKKRTIQIITAVVVVVLLALGIFWLVAGRDLALSHKMIGTWRGSQEREIGPVTHVSVAMTLSPDGKIVMNNSTVVNGLTSAIPMSGTWRIDGGRLKCKMSTQPQLREVDSRILTLTDDTLVMEQRASVGTMHRVKTETAQPEN